MNGWMNECSIGFGMCVLGSASKNVEWLLSRSSSADGLGLGLRGTLNPTCPRFAVEDISWFLVGRGEV